MSTTTSPARRIAQEFVPPIVTRGFRSLRARAGFAPARAARPPKGPLNPDLIEYGPDFYDNAFDTQDRWTSPYYKLTWYASWAVIAERVVCERGAPVLDMGCGAGHLARLLADRGIERYVGFDFSEKRLSQARLLVPEFRFEIADAYKTDLFETVDYQIVTCTEFLEHLAGDLEVLDRIRSGTRVLGTVPNYDATAHLRFFDNADEVQERYTDRFVDLTVTRIRNVYGGCEWLLDGHRV